MRLQTVSKTDGLDMKQRAIPERKSRKGSRTPGFLTMSVGFTDMKKFKTHTQEKAWGEKREEESRVCFVHIF